MSLDENRRCGNAAWPRIDALSFDVPGTKLWWCTLDASADQIGCWSEMLSAAERARAARFGVPFLRDRYVVGRAALRTVLAEALGLAPREVAIVRGVRGRPRLDGDSRLDFNVSHTAGVALIGLTNAGRIGVDIERRDRAINVSGIARKFLSEAERAHLAPMHADDARRAVLTLWTCKEAMSKATGDALSAPFARIDVDLCEGRRVRDGPDRYDPARWTLHATDIPPHHIATVALWRP
ncbi:MAG TPA: 4'-phosphopantetheinyl transferase superfamily protein [Casimicrobiaceae bacterium]|nr:4'-phosphopantetheinyl transferase superfamily protein [Casimicrobiaceae bacterium]